MKNRFQNISNFLRAGRLSLCALLFLNGLSSCSFMDSQWGSQTTSAGNEKKNNATITTYIDDNGKNLGLEMNFITLLTEVTIPDSLAGKYVVSLCFDGVTTKSGTTKITFPERVVHFDTLAGFSSLSTLILSKDLSYISDSSFTDCKNLTSLTIPREEPPVLRDEKFIANMATKTKIYVPANSVETYKAHEQWGQFESILEIPST